jgi:hypothetical protein
LEIKKNDWLFVCSCYTLILYVVSMAARTKGRQLFELTQSRAHHYSHDPDSAQKIILQKKKKERKQIQNI